MPEGLEQMPEADFRNLIWYLLNPPEDKRPWTPALRHELIGDEAGGGNRGAQLDAVPADLESVALWNPDWRVFCPPSEGAPVKLPEFAGRRNVLLTHPDDPKTPATLEREVALPARTKSVLAFGVAAQAGGDWQLRVLVDGSLLQTRIIRSTGETARWQDVKLDLSAWAGKTVRVRLENGPGPGPISFGYWSDAQITQGDLTAQAKP